MRRQRDLVSPLVLRPRPCLPLFLPASLPPLDLSRPPAPIHALDAGRAFGNLDGLPTQQLLPKVPVEIVPGAGVVVVRHRLQLRGLIEAVELVDDLQVRLFVRVQVGARDRKRELLPIEQQLWDVMGPFLCRIRDFAKSEAQKNTPVVQFALKENKSAHKNLLKVTETYCPEPVLTSAH